MKFPVMIALQSLVLRQAQAQNTLFADGGYQTEFPACLEQWTFKEKLADGTNLETTLGGCVSIDDFKPYPFFTDTVEEISNLFEPTDSRTDKTKWCAVIRDVYNPTPLKTEENRLNWGYCLDISTPEITEAPETDAPTIVEVTATPVTDSPTRKVTLAPTDSPTDETAVTDSPTQENNEATDSPTVHTTEVTLPPTGETENSPPDNEEQNNNVATTNEAALGQWTYVGIGIAASLVVLALVLVIFIAAMKKNKQEIVDDDDESDADLEENTITRS